jgi:uncharacterized protein (TIGR03118 family)
MKRRLVAALTGAVALAMLPVSAQANHGLGTSAFVHQTNLVSNQPGVAAVTDSHLVNGWGLSSSPTSPIWVSDNGADVSTLYNGTTGQPVKVAGPGGQMVQLVVSIAGGAPTGTVNNGTGDFVVSSGGNSGPARFIFASENGVISGWNPTVDGTHSIAEHTGTNAVYKGLAMGSVTTQAGTANFLYATNFRAGDVEMLDTNYDVVGTFTDPNVPSGFAPFGIQNVGGDLYVTFAKQDAAKHDDVAGRGNGFVDVFDTSGTLLERIASGGALNSPWGLAIAPASWGRVAGDLLVGNFGDGAINVFDPATHDWRGGLKSSDTGEPLRIDGLWGLRVGNGGSGGDPNAVLFSAGPDGESNGLLGTLTPAPPTG